MKVSDIKSALYVKRRLKMLASRRDRPSLVVSGARVLDPAVGHVADASLDILIGDGIVQDLVPSRGRSYAAETIDARGLLVLPGLINGHTHSHEGFHRGRYPKLPLEVWMHYPRSPIPLPLTSEDVYVRTLLAAVEAIRGGATTVVDDVALPGMESEHVDAVARAYTDAGVRALIAPSVFDRPYFKAVPFLEEEMPKDLLAELSAAPAPDGSALLERLDAILGRGHPRQSRVSFAVAPSAPQRCSTAFLSRVFALAARDGRPVITHVQETRLQVVAAQMQYGRSVVAELDALGLLGPLLSIVHGVWLSDDDIARLARSGASVQHNPVSNLRLGSGLSPVAAALETGANVTLGTDGVGSCITTRMLSAVRQTALLHSLRGEPPWVDGRTALAMATSKAARALGLADHIGSIAPGMRADLIGFWLDTPAFAPLNDPTRQLVYADDPALDTMLVDGRVVLRHGRLTTLDERDVLASARAAHRRLLPAMEASDRFVEERMRPVYERVHGRAMAHAIAAMVYPARFC